jgi:hypothetical protein
MEWLEHPDVSYQQHFGCSSCGRMSLLLVLGEKDLMNEQQAAGTCHSAASLRKHIFHSPQSDQASSQSVSTIEPAAA